MNTAAALAAAQEEVAAKAAAQQAGAAVLAGEAGIEDVEAFEEFVDPATITDTRRVEAGAPGVAGEGALALVRMQLIKEH